ncbi:retroviral-like aspartic protease family protein [Qipengyuania sp.]|uniref:retroviral-like aspartic protease family protein n=1 Tax=Qipengyuania sp. TaxID=2004515 RepID=UPI0035C86532
MRAIAALALPLALSAGQTLASEAGPASPDAAVDKADARMPWLPPASVDDTLAIGGTEIEGTKVRSRMTVPVTINGQGPYRFVVDSGADSSVVGYGLASTLGLAAGQRAILNSIAKPVYVDRVLVDELALGPTRIFDLQLPVLDERHLGAQGIVGLDALVEQRLMLDFEKRVISIDDGRSVAPMDGDVIVVSARLRKGQLILTNAHADSRRLDVVIDTGSELSIGNMAMREKLRRRNSDKFEKVAVTGVTGATFELEVARVRELRIGGIILRDVPIAFADVPPFEAFGLTKKPAMLLGTDVMEAFRKVSLDFRERRVRFQLRRCRPQGFSSRTASQAGLRLSSETPAACRR